MWGAKARKKSLSIEEKKLQTDCKATKGGAQSKD